MIKITKQNWKEKYSPLCFDYEGKIVESKVYLISTFGRIKRNGKFIAVSQNDKGYKQVVLNEPGFPTISRKVHRLVAITFIPNPNNLPQVNHKDRDVGNNFEFNLEWITNLDNIYHSLELSEKGVFTINEVKKICKLMEVDGWTYDSILVNLGYTRTDNRKLKSLKAIYNKYTFKEISKNYNIKPLTKRKVLTSVGKYFNDDIVNLICKNMETDGWTYNDILNLLKIEDSDKKKIVDSLYEIYTGRSYKHISKNYNIKPVTRNKKYFSKETIENICKCIANGMRNIDIMKLFDVSETQLLGIKKKERHKEISDKYF